MSKSRQQRRREARRAKHSDATTTDDALDRVLRVVCGLTLVDAGEVFIRALLLVADQREPDSHRRDAGLLSVILASHGDPACFDELLATAKELALASRPPSSVADSAHAANDADQPLVADFKENGPAYFANILAGRCPYCGGPLAPASAELSEQCGEPMLSCAPCKRMFGQPIMEKH